MSEDETAATGKPGSAIPSSHRGRRRPPTIEATAADLTPAPEPGSAVESVSEPETASAHEPAPGAAEPALSSTPDEKTADPAPMPEPAAVAAPRAPVWPALVAGIIGGAVAAAAISFALQQQAPQPAAPAAQVDQRIGTLEKSVAALDQSSRAALGRIDAEIRKQAAQPTASATVDLKPIDERMTKLEAALAGLNGSVASAIAAAKSGEAEAERRTQGAADQVTALSSRLAEAEKKLATVSGQQLRGNAAPVLAMVTAMRAGLGAGRPLGPEIEALGALGIEADRLSPLKPYATTPAPTGPALARRLETLAAGLEAPAPVAGDKAGLAQRLIASAASLVKVRPVGDTAGEDAASIAARMQAELGRNDFTAAGADAARLPATSREPLKPVLDALATRIAAASALTALEQDTIRAIAAQARSN